MFIIIYVLVQHTLDAHSGVLSDFDVQGHLLVTCGQTVRHGLTQPERFLMVYDLRIMRAVSPIQVLVPPYQLRFLPALSSRIVVLSSLGQVQLVDTAALSTPQLSIFQTAVSPIEGCSTISMDISPSNTCLAFGDTANAVHLYSSVAEPVFNPFGRETEFADPVVQLQPMDITDELAIYSSIPRPNLPAGESSYLSDYWPDRFNKQVFRGTPPVNPEILNTMKVVGTIGYARNVTNMKRNQVAYPNAGKFSKGSKDGNSPDDGERRGIGGSRHREEHESAICSLIPKHYRKVTVKLSKMGADDFDFDRYNQTGFCGLEASLPNSYCNAMLQILYYMEKLRVLMLNHTCDRENCVCCELSFLFHMMDISPGLPCHSGNFLRSLRTIPEASALGLVFTDQASVWKSNISRLIQSWNRFILHQISVQIGVADLKRIRPGSDYKSGSEASKENLDYQLLQQMFGMQQEKVNVCSKCKMVGQTQDTVLLCNLAYPNVTEDEPKPVSFQSVVCSSMCPEQTTPAWCEKCKKYQSTNQSRKLRSLPQILSLNAGLDNAQDLEFLRKQMELLYAEKKPPDTETEPKPTQTVVDPPPAPTPPPNIKACRYQQSCTRPDCKFWHPDNATQGTGASQHGVKKVVGEEDIGDKLAAIGVSWFPLSLNLKLLDNGRVVNAAEEVASEVKEYKNYNL